MSKIWANRWCINGSYVGQLSANIIMTELESGTVKNIFKDNLLKFYIAMSMTLLLSNESDIDTT